MNAKPLLAAIGGAAVVALSCFLPSRSNGQAGSDDAALAVLVAEVTAQQEAIAANQSKMDEKLALIAEDMRLARIFAARGGGKSSK